MTRILKVMLFMLFIQVKCIAQIKNNYYDSHDKVFQYIGRIDRSNDGEVRYDWAGVQVKFAFTGNKIGIRFNGGDRNYFDLLVDGEYLKTLHSPEDTLIWVEGIKGRGMHEAVFYKRTEGCMGQAKFYGVTVGQRSKLFPVENANNRHIEFIGNSITCGYGNEAKNSSERFSPETENNRKAYCAITARAFAANYTSISHSGLGVVRNYGDSQRVSTKEKSMPSRFCRTLDMDSTLTWDFKVYKPQAVVINLGTNDFSTTPHPDKKMFQDGYSKLLDDVREAYGNCPIFCLVGPMIDRPCYVYVKEIVENYCENNNDARVHFIGIPTALLNSTTDLGADYHPSYRGQAKIASFVVPVLSNVLNWNYSDEEIRSLINK